MRATKSAPAMASMASNGNGDYKAGHQPKSTTPGPHLSFSDFTDATLLDQIGAQNKRNLNLELQLLGMQSSPTSDTAVMAHLALQITQGRQMYDVLQNEYMSRHFKPLAKPAASALSPKPSFAMPSHPPTPSTTSTNGNKH